MLLFSILHLEHWRLRGTNDLFKLKATQLEVTKLDLKAVNPSDMPIVIS